MDDFNNINEDMVVDQTEIHQKLIEKRSEDEAKGDSERARKLTEKGFKYQRPVLINRRSLLHKRLMRKSSIIDNLLYSKQTLTVLKEKLGQFNGVFKLLTEVHEENKKLSSKSSSKSRSSCRSLGARSTSSTGSSTKERSLRTLMTELMVEASFIERKHTSRYQAKSWDLRKR